MAVAPVGGRLLIVVTLLAWAITSTTVVAQALRTVKPITTVRSTTRSTAATSAKTTKTATTTRRTTTSPSTATGNTEASTASTSTISQELTNEDTEGATSAASTDEIDLSREMSLVAKQMNIIIQTLEEEGSLPVTYGPVLVDIVNKLRVDESDLELLNADESMLVVALLFTLQEVLGPIPPSAADLVVLLANVASSGKITQELLAVVPSLVYRLKEGGAKIPPVQTTVQLLAAFQQLVEAGAINDISASSLLLNAINNLLPSVEVLEIAVASEVMWRNTSKSMYMLVKYMSVVNGPLPQYVGSLLLAMFQQLQQAPPENPYLLSNDLTAKVTRVLQDIISSNSLPASWAKVGAAVDLPTSSSPHLRTDSARSLMFYGASFAGMWALMRSA